MPGDFIPAGPYVSAVDAQVADAINDGTTTVAPSQNAVYDALALKANSANPTLTGTVTVPDASFSNAKLTHMAARTFKGRHTNSTGVPEDVTAANVLADLIAAAGTPNGSKFIRDDGTLALPSGLTAAQFGDGSDGDVTISSNTTLTSNKFYRNLTINSGVTLTVDGYGIWVSGTLTLNGTISAKGGDAGIGQGYQPGVAAGSYLRPMSNGAGAGASGINGGEAGGSIPGGSNRSGGAGGTGGNGSSNNGGAAASVTQVDTTTYRMGLFAGNTQAQNGGNRIGGGTGGGAGGWQSGVAHGGGGGGGGDVIVLITRHVTGSGTVTAAGGNGAANPGGNTGGGGGGGGGMVVFVCADASHSLTITVAGGTGGVGSGTGTAGAAGANGIKIEVLGGV